MPIIKALLVVPEGMAAPKGAAQGIADAVAQVLRLEPARVWVTLQHVPADGYAENGVSRPPRPLFIEVLHADLPAPEQIAVQSKALARAIGSSLGLAPELVHIEYAPAARGRLAFGGQLLT